MKHWLLSTSDREHGGKLVLGIFESNEDAWNHYHKTHDKNQQYYRIPFVECWENEMRGNMKLFLFDEKHQQVIAEMPFHDEVIPTVNNIIEFLQSNGITNRYKQLVIAESYTQSTNEDGFNQITFQS